METQTQQTLCSSTAWKKGPDTTPPLIVSTNLLNNMPIAFDQSSIDLEIYTNEPADCKWDYLDKDYENMDNSFTCSKKHSSK